MKLIALLLSLISTSAYCGTLHLGKAATGKVRQAADIRYANHDEKQTYQLKIGKQWMPGSCSSSGTGNLHALLLDMNFDGHADLWVTGYTDSQGRVRCSDVWLWDTQAKQYSFNKPLSAIPNLDISIADKRIEGGIANCGCAAQCFYEDSYAWRADKLIATARREQDCERYREYRLNDKQDLIIVKDEIIDSGNSGQQAIENTKVVDWQRLAHSMRKPWE
ncbi:XAC2610-related protein [Janthinobacterium sp. LB3P118]|uniref:XAC2610-related protein n=1 Tax=Janthinobacterium sp. LB3P118 TaxID=3424195 RepID=UPI003F290691